MDIITRTFTKEVSKDRTLRFNFKTYDCIFRHLTPDDKNGLILHYLNAVFTGGRESKDNSPSKAKKLMLDVKKIESPLTAFAKKAEYHESRHYQHLKVQNAFMSHDRNCIAVEAPVYDNEMSGFIDILRIPGPGKIQVAEFKPDAHRDRHAPTQVYYYCKMLSECSGIPLENIEGVYFDDKNAYQITF